MMQELLCVLLRHVLVIEELFQEVRLDHYESAWSLKGLWEHLRQYHTEEYNLAETVKLGTQQKKRKELEDAERLQTYSQVTAYAEINKRQIC